MPPKAKTAPPKKRGRRRNLEGDGPLSPKIEKFCQGIADGLWAGESYRQHIAEPGTTVKSSWEAASVLVKSLKVASRIRELQRDFNGVLNDVYHYGKQQHAAMLIGIITTPVGEMTEASSHAQKVKRTIRKEGKGEDAKDVTVEEIEGPNKLQAGDQLAKMAGWYPKDEADTAAAGASAEVLEALTNLINGKK